MELGRFNFRESLKTLLVLAVADAGVSAVSPAFRPTTAAAVDHPDPLARVPH